MALDYGTYWVYVHGDMEQDGRLLDFLYVDSMSAVRAAIESDGGTLAEGPERREPTRDGAVYAWPAVRELSDQGGTEHARTERSAR